MWRKSTKTLADKIEKAARTRDHHLSRAHSVDLRVHADTAVDGCEPELQMAGEMRERLHHLIAKLPCRGQD